MRVLLKATLDCTPDAAWRALQSPAVLREIYGPLIEVDSLVQTGFPTVWDNGPHPVYLYAFGAIPLGSRGIDIERRRVPAEPDVRMLRDTGESVSGLVSLITRWDHRIAISAGEPGPAGAPTTLYRDQLIVEAGAWTILVWFKLWALWQWRCLKLKSLAPGWQYNLGADDSL